MRPGLADFNDEETADFEIEAAIIYDENNSLPLAGQLFFLMEKSAADIIPLIDTNHETAMETLRTTAIRFLITDAKGKAKKSGLKSGTYFVCGVRQTQSGFDVWNVQMELKPGKNSLVLDNRNMTKK